MAGLRKDKVASMMKKLISDFLKEEIETDLLITITDISLSNDLKNATVRVSVYPDGKEQDILTQIIKKRRSIRQYVMSKTKMKVTPKFIFEIDKGEKNRQKIDKLLYDIKE